jgi:hypothetical protein
MALMALVHKQVIFVRNLEQSEQGCSFSFCRDDRQFARAHIGERQYFLLRRSLKQSRAGTGA